MNDILQQLVTIVYGVWRKRYFALAAAWLICIAGWTFVAQIPNKYESKARIHVDAETLLEPLMQGLTVSNNIYDQVVMMRQTLISRPNIEKVIRMTDLDLTVQPGEETDELIDEITDNIAINIQAANLFQIGYEHDSPVVAKKIVQSLLNIFIEDKLGDSRKDLSSALRFIEEQIREYEEQLEIQEQRKAAFRQKNIDFLSGDTSYFEKVKQSQQQVAIVKQQINESQSRIDQLATYLKDIPEFVAAGGSGPALGGGGRVSSGISNIASRINLMEQRLDDLYARGYKDQHPDVKILLGQINDLKAKQEKEQKEFAKALEEGDSAKLQSTGAVSPNPLYDQVSVKIIDLESEMASLNSRLQERENALKLLTSKAQRVPEIEAELARLNRDYDILKGNYNQLLAKREAAKISQDLETKSDRIQFRVIEPPQEARDPSSPNRLILVAAVLFAGLGGGVGVAFLLSQIHSTFSSEQRLRDEIGLPVLGSVSVISSMEEITGRKRKLALFSIMLAGLFISCASVYVLMDWYYKNNITV